MATAELNKELYDKFMECVNQEPDEAAKVHDKYPFCPKIIVEFRTLGVWVDLGYLDCLL